MITSDDISEAYSKARAEIVKKNPKMARNYVLTILNYTLKSYNAASTILQKAELQSFMDKWIAVSKDLYEKGITDYVLDCFGLLEKKQPKKVKAETKPQSPAKPAAKEPPQGERYSELDKPQKEEIKKQPLPPGPAEAAVTPSGKNSGGSKAGKALPEIDISGLIDESSSQGWCADVFNANKRAVVRIHVYNNTAGYTGTGFIISEKGYLLTNNHVVFNEDSKGYWPHLTMNFADENITYPIKLLWVEKKWDLALCSFDPSKVPGFTVVRRITDYSKLLPGADCLVIGNAFGMGLAPCEGVVRFVKNQEGDLVYTAPSNPGDSGGPVFSRNGECIGINKSRTETVGNTVSVGYTNATPMDVIDNFLSQWCKHSKTSL